MREMIALLELAALAYFALLGAGYALALLLAARQLNAALLADSDLNYEDLLSANNHKPISILVPAFNEEATIVDSVRSFLNLHYPTFEVIVVSDGSSDATVEQLRRAFDLAPTQSALLNAVHCKRVLAAYRSRKYPNLLVVDKENGGKADALNAGLNHANYPLFCAVDADSLLDARALARASLSFARDPSMVAVGGTIRPLNRATVANGSVSRLRAPRTWIERFQVIEYTRAFLTGRSAFSAFRMLLLISGAFGLFRRSDVIDAGGYDSSTVGEDMELVIRLHRHKSDRREPYRIRYLVDPICWTQVPSDPITLHKQRDRWHRGLLEALWRHRGMLLNPRYGRIGMVAMPIYWLFEALDPLFQIAGVMLFVILGITGMLDPAYAAAFLMLVVLYGLLLSVASVGMEVFMRTRYARVRDRFVLLLAAVLENLGYRQWMTVVRAGAFLTVFRRRGQWGKMKRQKLRSPETTRL